MVCKLDSSLIRPSWKSYISLGLVKCDGGHANRVRFDDSKKRT